METDNEKIAPRKAKPPAIIGFVPGEKFKTQQEVEAAIEEELRRDD